MRLILLNLFRLVLLLIFVAAIRALIGHAGRALSRLGIGKGPSSSAAGAPRSGGALVKDPVCGVFVSAASSVTKTVNGEVIHFCSAACRDKFPKA